MLIGYTRPFQNDVTSEKQIEWLSKRNCSKIISEQHDSANNREELQKMIDQLNEGDKIIVTKLSVLADSIPHLAELITLIEQKGAFVQSINEEIDTSTTEQYSLSSMINHLARFQSDVISEKTKKGLTKAKQKGISTGRPRKPDKNVRRAMEMHKSGNYSLADIRNETGISKSTLYRYLEMNE